MPYRKFIDERIDLLEQAAALSHICGGSVSSSQLQYCLEFRYILCLVLRQANIRHIERVDVLIKLWRDQLGIHNAQELKVFEYDLETGRAYS